MRNKLFEYVRTNWSVFLVPVLLMPLAACNDGSKSSTNYNSGYSLSSASLSLQSGVAKKSTVALKSLRDGAGSDADVFEVQYTGSAPVYTASTSYKDLIISKVSGSCDAGGYKSCQQYRVVYTPASAGEADEHEALDFAAGGTKSDISITASVPYPSFTATDIYTDTPYDINVSLQRSSTNGLSYKPMDFTQVQLQDPVTKAVSSGDNVNNCTSASTKCVLSFPSWQQGHWGMDQQGLDVEVSPSAHNASSKIAHIKLFYSKDFAVFGANQDGTVGSIVTRPTYDSSLGYTAELWNDDFSSNGIKLTAGQKVEDVIMTRSDTTATGIFGKLDKAVAVVCDSADINCVIYSDSDKFTAPATGPAIDATSKFLASAHSTMPWSDDPASPKYDVAAFLFNNNKLYFTSSISNGSIALSDVAATDKSNMILTVFPYLDKGVNMLKYVIVDKSAPTKVFSGIVNVHTKAVVQHAVTTMANFNWLKFSDSKYATSKTAGQEYDNSTVNSIVGISKDTVQFLDASDVQSDGTLSTAKSYSVALDHPEYYSQIACAEVDVDAVAPNRTCYLAGDEVGSSTAKSAYVVSELHGFDPDHFAASSTVVKTNEVSAPTLFPSVKDAVKDLAIDGDTGNMLLLTDTGKLYFAKLMTTDAGKSVFEYKLTDETSDPKGSNYYAPNLTKIYSY